MLAGFGRRGDDMTRKPLAIALLLGYALFYLVALDNRPLQRLDEFRHAEVAREMLVNGDLVSPRLNGVRYFEKPVLGYWTSAASQAVFGDSDFAVRLPSALSTGLTALFIVVFLGRFVRKETAILAGFVYLTSLYVFALGSTNILDPVLNLWLTVAVGFYYWAYSEPSPARRRAYLALAGASCGLAFLAKGFLAFAVLAIIIVPFLVWQREWSRILRDAWLPILAAAVVVLPWGIAIHLREPDFWNYFFWVEHIQRFASDKPQHAEPPWYFVVRFPVMALPWLFLIPVAISGLRNFRDNQSLVRYLTLWFVMPFLFFSASGGKLVSYVLPCFPALAMLVAVGLEKRLGEGATKSVRNSLIRLLILYGLIFGFVVLNGMDMAGRPILTEAENGRWMLALAALAFGIVVCAIGLRQSDARRIWLTGVSLLCIMLALPFVIPDRTRLSKMPSDFFTRHEAVIEDDAIFVSDGLFFRSVAWHFRRDDLYMLNAGELAYGLAYPDAAHRLLDGGVSQLVAENDGRREIVIICDESSEPALTGSLPASAERIQEGRYILWRIPARSGGRLDS
jgi:4-amino-4-deoxy-L-arabinose transferase